MKPHPDFSAVVLPRNFALGDFRFTPLSPEFTEEDFEVVTSSSVDLKGFFDDDWPTGLTLDSNRIDLAWHEREFTTSRSFSWIVRDESGLYLGCFYIFPEIASRGHATAALWIKAMERRGEILDAVAQLLQDWCKEALPETVSLTWKYSPAPPTGS